MADSKNLPEEVAKLTEALRELRDREVAGELAGLKDEIAKLRAERDAHTCHGCHCGHACWHPTPTWVYTPTITYGTPAVTTICSSAATNTAGWTVSNNTAGAAGGGTTTYMIGN